MPKTRLFPDRNKDEELLKKKYSNIYTIKKTLCVRIKLHNRKSFLYNAD